VLGDCIDLDLGMANSKIKDDKINASSSLNASTPASNSRLNYTAGSSWCASTGDSNPYLQIDLQTLHIICAVSTQGNSQADQWVETYTLQSSTVGKTWTDYNDVGQVKIFTGNNDRDTVNRNIIYEGVLARWLRFVGKTKHNNYCMRVEVFGVRQKPENLAAGKATSQSSTYSEPWYNGQNGASEKAVDGNPDTHFTKGHCSHTKNDTPSWWRVDLDSDNVPVFEVSIVNRFGTNQRRFKDYKITLGNNQNVTSNPKCVGRYTFISFVASAVCYRNPLKAGRYLGIMTTRKQFLQLCGVEVYSRENLAIGKETDQSSNHRDVDSSSKAVDGNSNTRYFDGNSCTHTKNEANPWWRVDLGRVEPVTEVYIVNRGVCCGWRLGSFEIRVGSSPTKVGAANPKCGAGGSVFLKDKAPHSSVAQV